MIFSLPIMNTAVVLLQQHFTTNYIIHTWVNSFHDYIRLSLTKWMSVEEHECLNEIFIDLTMLVMAVMPGVKVMNHIHKCNFLHVL